MNEERMVLVAKMSDGSVRIAHTKNEVYEDLSGLETDTVKVVDSTVTSSKNIEKYAGDVDVKNGKLVKVERPKTAQELAVETMRKDSATLEEKVNAVISFLLGPK